MGHAGGQPAPLLIAKAKHLDAAGDAAGAWKLMSMAADRLAVSARDDVLAVGVATGVVERSEVLTAEAILAQLRAIVADLLMVTGMGQLEATDALPPPR